MHEVDATEEALDAADENVPYQHGAYSLRRNENPQFSVPKLFPSEEQHARRDTTPAQSDIGVIDYADDNLIN